MARQAAKGRQSGGRSPTSSASKTSPVLASLKAAAGKVEGSKALRPGEIVLRLTGSGGGTFSASYSREGAIRVQETAAVGANPLLEVLASADVVRQILDGEKDAVKEFLAGGIRIRGDIRLFSDLALELKLIDRPL